ncbi:phospholipase D-like domain-containing protein [Nocardioides panacihumi]|uniref:phospholipase D-like domain-containing protein n=1 Tax=Nocardioides panacihumi TaxID=400774 RepID=UPI0031D2E46C
MRRLLVAGMVAMTGALAASTVGVLETPAGAPPASAAAAASPALLPPLPGWKPSLGPIFNEPGKARSTAIVNRVLQAIRHTPRGETIRMATYSFDRGEIAAALRKARSRGVRVQVIVNERTASGVVFSLQRTLGSNPRRNNFVVTCPGRCRAPGDGGNQHIKIFSFTRTGGTRDLIIGGSGNLTSKAVYRQWNDSWAIAYDPKVFNTWVGFFKQMKFQHRRGARVVQTSQSHVAHPYQIWLQRQTVGSATAPLARSAAQDPVVRRIRSVGCNTRAGYGNANGHTVVRIMEYALFGGRGNQIANAIAALKRGGCDVMVIGAVFSPSAIGIMQHAGVPVRMADWSFAERVPAEEDGLAGWGPRFYAHFKAMIVSGSYRGPDGVQQPTKSVWTGSENWSGISFANEEVVVRFTDPAYYQAYFRQFNHLWTGRATHRAGIEPLNGPPA